MKTLRQDHNYIGNNCYAGTILFEKAGVEIEVGYETQSDSFELSAVVIGKTCRRPSDVSERVYSWLFDETSELAQFAKG